MRIGTDLPRCRRIDSYARRNSRTHLFPEIRIGTRCSGSAGDPAQRPGRRAFDSRRVLYVDEPPGTYTVVTATEVERKISFELTAGQTRYVRTAVGFGVLVGHVTPSLVWPDSAEAEIQDLHYTGNSIPAAARASGAAAAVRPPAVTAPAPAAAAQTVTVLKRVTAGEKEVKLSWHATWNKQCVAGEAPDLTLIREPAHGHVEVRSESFQLANTATMTAPCDGTTVPGKVVYYIPDPDYHGDDHVDYRISSRYRTYTRAVSIEIN